MVQSDELADADMLSLPEVHHLLDKEREDRGELSYEQKLAEEHAKTFDRLGGVTKARELKKKLLEIDRVSEEHAVKLVTLCPQHPDEVAVVFAQDRQDLSDEDSDTIISIVKEYLD